MPVTILKTDWGPVVQATLQQHAASVAANTYSLTGQKVGANDYSSGQPVGGGSYYSNGQLVGGNYYSNGSSVPSPSVVAVPGFVAPATVSNTYPVRSGLPPLAVANTSPVSSG